MYTLSSTVSHVSILSHVPIHIFKLQNTLPYKQRIRVRLLRRTTPTLLFRTPIISPPFSAVHAVFYDSHAAQPYPDRLFPVPAWTSTPSFGRPVWGSANHSHFHYLGGCTTTGGCWSSLHVLLFIFSEGY